MQQHSNPGPEQRRTGAGAAARLDKRPYVAPGLTIYGDFHRLTMAGKGGFGQDGPGAPKSKATGST